MPIIAVMADKQKVEDQIRYTADSIPVNTLARLDGLIPLLIPPLKEELQIDALLEAVDGVFITGGLTNVHPSCYGRTANAGDGPFDPSRDVTVLPLIKKAVQQGVPILMAA